MKIDDRLYTPAIFQSIEPLVLFGFGVRNCPTCDKPMVMADGIKLKECGSIYGSYHTEGNTIEAQCKRGGIVLQSEMTNKDGEIICGECALAGRLPAKKWIELTEKLWQEHRYDHE